MAKKIFITATNTDIGKTYTTKLLLKEFAKMGLRVGVIKPIETGVVDGYAPDGVELLELVRELNSEFDDISLEDIVPITYELPAAPFVASGGKQIDLSRVQNSIKKLEKRCDILLIEGAGGLLVPIYAKTMMVDMIEYLDADALLVTHCALGCINDTMLSKKVLEDKNIAHLVAFNCHLKDIDFENISQPYFQAIGLKILKINKNIDTICDVLYNL